MNVKAHRPAIEIAAEWIAASALGAAVGFATLTLSEWGYLAAAAVALGGAVLALFTLGRIDAEALAGGTGLVLVDFPQANEERDADGAAVLLLDEAVEPDVLLLDTPLTRIEESRVVRLFGGAPGQVVDDGPMPAPGDMLARIENFLGVARGSAQQAGSGPLSTPEPADASAALHAALADIRRSLRQG